VQETIMVTIPFSSIWFTKTIRLVATGKIVLAMQHILLYLPNLCAVANQYHQNAASNHI
jgi:hypothetical protein